MQHDRARATAASPPATEVLGVVTKPVAITPLSAERLPRLPALPPAPALPQPAAARLDLPQDTPTRLSPGEEAMPAASGQADAAGRCVPQLTLTVGAAAMIDMTLSAPCHPGARVVVNAAGLTFTGQTSAKGELTVEVPAMARATRITVRFPDGRTVAASAAVPELDLFDRVAVQWMGDDAFALHALEFGAAYGSAGDISAAAPRLPADATQDRGGFLTRLGSTKVALPMQAEVYTYPAGLSSRKGTVRFTVEAPVTAKTCGREMLAQTLQVSLQAGADAPKAQDLSLSMPGCDVAGQGQVVELPGLLPALRIAGR